MRKLLLLGLFVLLFIPIVSADPLEGQFMSAYNLTSVSDYNLTRNLTNSGGVTFVTGKVGTAANLTGANKLTNLALSSWTSSESITVAFWYYPQATPTQASCDFGFNTLAILQWSYSTDKINNNICYTSGGQLRWLRQPYGVGINEFNSGLVLPLKQWTHVVLVYNESNGTQQIYLNGTLAAANVNVTNGSIAIGNYFIIGEAYDPGGATYYQDPNGAVDSVLVYNFAMNSANVSWLYNNSFGREPPFNFTTAAAATNLTITLTDAYTGVALGSASAIVNGTNYTNASGNIIYTNFSSSPVSYLVNITINSTDNGGYRARTYTNYNSSTALSTNISQSAITFLATEKISNSSLLSVSFATTYLTNSTHYMRAGTYNVTATKSGYFPRSQSYTAVADTTASATIANLSATRINLSVRNAVNGSTVNTFTAQFNNSAYAHSETASTANGTILLDLIAGNWTIFIDAAGYSYTVSNVTLVAGTNNVTINAYGTESINFFVYDEQSGSLITNKTTTIELIGSAASYNVTTTNGTRYVDLVTPDSYTVRYYASGYNTRFGYITITSRSSQNVSLYLLAAVNGTNVTATVYQQDGSLVDNALVKVAKYDLPSNSYIVREQILTNFEGKVTFDVLSNQEYYKFIVEYPIGTVALTTDPSYIDSSEITLVITSDIAGTDYRYVLGAGGDLTWNNVSQTFRFTWSDTSSVIEETCMYVWRVQTNYTATYLNESCSTSTAGTLLITVPNITDAVYVARGYFTIDGSEQFVDEEWGDLRGANRWGGLGLVVAVVLTIAISFLFLSNPSRLVLSLPVGITVTNLIGITYFSIWVPVAFWAVCIIVVFVMGRER